MHKIRHELALVIVTLDRDGYVRNLIKDLASQQTLPGSCVVVDQGTPGAKDEVLAPLEELGVRCSYLFSSFRSISAARNVGLAHARTAEVILYLDDDVELEGDVIAGHMKYYAEEPETVALAGHVTCLPLGEEFERLNTFRPEGDHIRQGRGCHMSFRARVLHEIGGFNAYIANRGDETELYRRLRKAGYRVRNASEVVVKHLVSGSGGNREVAEWSHSFYVRTLRDGIVRIAKDRGYLFGFAWPFKNFYIVRGLVRTASSRPAGCWTLLRELGHAYRLAWLSCRRDDYIPVSLRLSSGYGVDGRTGLPTF